MAEAAGLLDLQKLPEGYYRLEASVYGQACRGKRSKGPWDRQVMRQPMRRPMRQPI